MYEWLTAYSTVYFYLVFRAIETISSRSLCLNYIDNTSYDYIMPATHIRA